ncbi:MBL fold metallo-hydrolase [Thalassotalea insulae]|uniref:MBL fold metallo-hydrolase n=1 Tax=Thalassotalea insulae TaxID=2056778 RepID=A0ABQ6GWV4_9GAMM|nr:MBL fold metallo-hydrolase [Thalassotalea insulae]GLX80337.1 MBL fold metallo-hydrolase [Thalassotalea insulae]
MKITTKISLIIGSLILMLSNIALANIKHNKVTSLKVTTLSTMLANQGIGEWGYSALIEVDGKKILFDTGNRPNTVLKNAKDLGIDLSDVEDVILSHNHGDHTGGLLTLRNALKKQNPKALTKVHVGKGIFAQRVGRENNMLKMKHSLEADNVKFFIYENATEIIPGVWLTGNVARKTNEKNWNGKGKVSSAKGDIEDIIQEDLSLAIYTEQGFVLIAGCGHAGIVNTMAHIVNHIHPGKIDAAIGGFHLLNANETQLQWTADKLNHFGLTQMIGAHCTGLNALYSLRAKLNGDRTNFVVGSVGDQFDLESGIKAGYIAR